MPLGLGLAASHSPVLHRSRSDWEQIYQELVLEVPQDTRALVETPDVLDDYEARVGRGFAALGDKLKAYAPSALIIAVADTGRVFAENHVPQLSICVAEEIWGTTHYPEIGEKPDDSRSASIRINQDVARWLVDELTEEGFDMNVNRTFRPLGDSVNGAPQSLMNTYSAVARGLDIPVVPLFVNAHMAPTISGRRLPALGRAIADVLADVEDKVAILGVGGLSGDPQGYVAGWIDELLDDWILGRLKRGRSQQLETLWDIDSITLRGSTAEVRNWIVAGAAMERLGARATIVDYIRFHHAAVGTGFAYWETAERS